MPNRVLAPAMHVLPESVPATAPVDTVVASVALMAAVQVLVLDNAAAAVLVAVHVADTMDMQAVSAVVAVVHGNNQLAEHEEAVVPNTTAVAAAAAAVDAAVDTLVAAAAMVAEQALVVLVEVAWPAQPIGHLLDDSMVSASACLGRAH